MEMIYGKNTEIINLSEEILKNIESSELSLSNITTKCLRLARLLNDFESIKWFSLELSGYNSRNDEYVPQDEWLIAKRSNRNSKSREWDGEKYIIGPEKITVSSIGQLEASITASKQQLSVAQDPDINFHPINAWQPVPTGNNKERNTLSNNIAQNTATLDRIKNTFYNYVLNIYYQYKFGDHIQNLFGKYQEKVDNFILKFTPDLAKEFKSIHDNIMSQNEKDWNNIGTNCRRLLKVLADNLYPAKQGVTEISHNGKNILVTEDKYINRLMLFIENSSKNSCYKKIIGSQVSYIGGRIDSIDQTGSKGTHYELDLEEAERLSIFTYILVGDILSLASDSEEKNANLRQEDSSNKNLENTSMIQESPSPSFTPTE